MVDGMIGAWAWSPADRTVLVLPLNHVHGLVNVTLTPLAVGACCEAPGAFDAAARVGAPGVAARSPCSWPCRPIYARLVAAWEAADAATAAALVDRRGRAAADGVGLGRAAGVDARRVARADRPHAARALRHDRARHGAVEHARRGGCPATSASRCPASSCASSTTPATPSPTARRASCSCAGRRCSPATGSGPTPPPRRSSTGGSAPATSPSTRPAGFRLLGRSSVDIIKTGGEKVSALEIEEVYRTHPGIADCRRRRPARRRVGPAGRLAAVAGARRDARRRRAAGVGQGPSSPRPRSRPASRSSPTSPATRSARSSSPRSPKLFD